MSLFIIESNTIFVDICTYTIMLTFFIAFVFSLLEYYAMITDTYDWIKEKYKFFKTRKNRNHHPKKME